MSRRAQATGRSEHVDRFAMLPETLLREPAVIHLRHSSFRVLAIIATQCWVSRDGRSGRNGTAALTGSFAAQYGLRSNDTVYPALQELCEKRLLVRTRQGLKQRNVPSLYAVGWLPITHIDGQPLEVWRPAPHGYRTWRLEFDPEIRDRSRQPSAKCDPGIATTAFPESGEDRAEYAPVSPVERPSLAPESGDTSRFSGEANESLHTRLRESTSRAAAVDVDELRRKVRKLHNAQPHLTPRELGRICHVPDSHLAAVLDGLA
jgi:hypothetical protein